MRYKKGTIPHLQKYIGSKIKERGFEDEELHERLLMLTEELGELVNACRKLNGMYYDTKRKIEFEAGEQIADVLNMLFSVAIKLGIDTEKEFLKKEIIIDKKRFYKRAKKKI